MKLQTRNLQLSKNIVLHIYFWTILLKVLVIAYCIKAMNFLMHGGDNKYYEGNEKQAVKGKNNSVFQNSFFSLEF